MTQQHNSVYVPSDGTLRKLKKMTEENSHSAARVVACAWLDDAWRMTHKDERLSPFGPLLAAFDRLEAQHAQAGCISPALLKLRAALWKQTQAVAEDEGMNAVFAVLANCL